MPALKDELRSALTASMKDRNALRSSTLRMALAALQTAEVAGAQARVLSDDEVIGVLATEVKKRKEAAEAFESAGRTDLSDKERAEAVILTEFLPAQLSDEEIVAIVTEAITTTGAASIKQMGQVMGIVTPKTKGRADGSEVAAEVKKQLGAL